MTKYDVVVVGSGLAGMFTATNLADAGKKVAIIEARDWGGTTINRGSTAKKAILALAELHHQLEQFKAQGFDSVPDINWSDAMMTRDWLVEDQAARSKRRLIEAGVTTFEGSARFIDHHTLDVQGRRIYADNIVLATGSKPRPLHFEGSQFADHSGDLMRLHQLPKTIVLIGAGIVAMSLISSFAQAGTKIHVVQYDNKILKAFDDELVHIIVRRLKNRDVEFHMNAEVQSIKQLDDRHYQVHLTTGELLKVDGVYDVAGRVPDIEGLEYDKAGLAVNEHGFSVNDFLQTNQAHIYALGDCCDANVPKLASYADYQAKYLAKALLSPRPEPITYPKYPASTVFSIPKIGSVGLSVKEAQKDLDTYYVKTLDMTGWQNYRRIHDDLATMKVIVRRQDNHVVGAEIVSDTADILINYLAILLNREVSMQELQDIIFAYPSIATDLYGFWT